MSSNNYYPQDIVMGGGPYDDTPTMDPMVGQSQTSTASAVQKTGAEYVAEMLKRHIDALMPICAQMGNDAKTLPPDCSQYAGFIMALSGQVAGIAYAMKHTIGEI